MRRLRRATAGLAAAALAACGAGSPGQPAPSSDAAAAPPAQPAAAAKEAAPAIDDDVSSVVGKPAPGWDLPRWFNAAPLTLEDLRGKVVLVRWFMSTECPYCSGTAPSLNQLHEAYAARGLAVIGMYHHKRPEPLDPQAVRGYVERYQFKFPVAIDEDWRTLKRWWLDGHERRWTSVSFVIDRRGVVRYVHLGGKYAPGDADYEKIRATIEQLLAEPAR